MVRDAKAVAEQAQGGAAVGHERAAVSLQVRVKDSNVRSIESRCTKEEGRVLIEAADAVEQAQRGQMSARRCRGRSDFLHAVATHEPMLAVLYSKDHNNDVLTKSVTPLSLTA